MRKNGVIGINADSGELNGNLETLETMLGRFQEAGFGAVELPVHGLQLVLNGKVNPGHVRKVMERLKHYDFRYTMHGVDGINLLTTTHEEEHLSVVKASLEAAGEMGIELMVLHSSRTSLSDPQVFQGWKRRFGTDLKVEIKNKLMDTEAELLHGVGEFAAQQGVMIAVENNFCDAASEEYTSGISGYALSALMEKVDHSHIGITYDVGHGYLSAIRNNFDFLEDFSQTVPYIRHLHLHDNFGKKPEAQDDHRLRAIDRIPFGWGDLHLPLGQGIIPIDSVCKRMKEYQGIYCLELEPRYSEEYEKQIDYIKGRIV